MIESEKYCKLCGKLLYKGTAYHMKEYKWCSDCYLISSGSYFNYIFTMYLPQIVKSIVRIVSYFLLDVDIV
ncbi:hypothetical protein RirG_096790 [Rhizophagus irregularis DAOM 197198w]|uniref:Uncharacterized protein n=1 Tax=Rhizophagus irregularis (strain DAOM 197198w) TaxID=1432141 RepID=A0A015KP50_RHIIW|nr:hypothetical protein RirG_096790 [Rhizophagus irregularis DAOM 197198w]